MNSFQYSFTLNVRYTKVNTENMKKILFVGILLLAGLFSLQYSLLGNRSSLTMEVNNKEKLISHQPTTCATFHRSDTIIIIRL